MSLPVPPPSPILSVTRWVMATLANVAHLEGAAIVANHAPVPPSVTAALSAAPVTEYGQIGAALVKLILDLPLQLFTGVWHYPLGAMAVAWWCVESWLLARAAFVVVMAMIFGRRPRQHENRGNQPPVYWVPPRRGPRFPERSRGRAGRGWGDVERPGKPKAKKKRRH